MLVEIKVHKVQPVHRQLAMLVVLDQLDLKELLAHRQLDQEEFKEQEEHKDLKEQAQEEHKVYKALLETQDILEFLAEDILDHRVLRAKRV